MLSLGIAVYEQGTLTGTFSRNLELLPGAVQDPETMEWWKKQPEAWEICRQDQQDPARVMKECAEWIECIPAENRIAVGWPIAFDFAFVNWYFWRFVGRNPLGFSGLDLRSYMAGLNKHPAYLKLPESEINQMVQRRPYLKPHVAVDDAVQQGDLLMAALEFAQKEGRYVHQ